MTPGWPMMSLVLALGLAACAAPREVVTTLPRLYPEGERIFHADPRWLGGDAVISVPLSEDRTLWLFGDSFIGHGAHPTRRDAAFVHNSVAIERGDDPRTASMQFAWDRDAKGEPAAFFADDNDAWFWPGGGVRLPNGALALFMTRVAATESGAGPLGFAARGYALILIANPDAPPQDWHQRRIDGPALPFGALPGAAAIMQGSFVVVLAIQPAGGHDGSLARYRLVDLERGDLRHGEWWGGPEQGWRPAVALPPGGPAVVIKDVGAEASIHWDSCAHAYDEVSSQGFGASTIAMRTAPALTGPWSVPRTIYQPPESKAPGAFVYAGKAHAEQVPYDQRGLVLTYVASSFRPDDLLTPPGDAALYWPRMVLAPAPACPSP